MIVGVTGSDCSGKSTLVKGLTQLMNCPSRHFDKPKDLEDGKKQYFDFAKEMNVNPNKDIIADRLHEGEWVYAPLYRGYKADYMREIETELVRSQNFLHVYVKAELNTIIDRARTRGEDFVKEEDFKKVLDLFDDYMNEQALPYIEIDTTNSKTPDDLKRIEDAANKVDVIWNSIRAFNNNNLGMILKPALPRGNVNAEVMVIGQNPGGRGNGDYSTVWAGGPTSEFILNATKNAGIHRKTWYTNLVPYPTPDNKITKEQIQATEKLIDLQISLIKPKKIITLGGQVGNFVHEKYEKDFHVVTLQHPTYVKRFFSGKPEKLKEYYSKFGV